MCNGAEIRSGVAFPGHTFASFDTSSPAECCTKCMAWDTCTHWTFQPFGSSNPADGKPNCRLKSRSEGPPSWELAQQGSAEVTSGTRAVAGTPSNASPNRRRRRAPTPPTPSGDDDCVHLATAACGDPVYETWRPLQKTTIIAFSFAKLRCCTRALFACCASG